MEYERTEVNHPEYTWEVVLGDGTEAGKANFSFGVYLYKFLSSQKERAVSGSFCLRPDFRMG